MFPVWLKKENKFSSLSFFRIILTAIVESSVEPGGETFPVSFYTGMVHRSRIMFSHSLKAVFNNDSVLAIHFPLTVSRYIANATGVQFK